MSRLMQYSLCPWLYCIFVGLGHLFLSLVQMSSLSRSGSCVWTVSAVAVLYLLSPGIVLPHSGRSAVSHAVLAFKRLNLPGF